MRDGRYRVEVFVPGGGEDYDYGGVHVRRFKTRQLPSGILPFLFRRWNTRSCLAAIEKAGIRFEDIAVCHGNTAIFSIYPLAVKANNPQCKTLLHHHDPQSFGLGASMLRHCWLKNVIEFPILRHFHEQIDCHVFISEVVKRSFLAAPDASWTIYEGYSKQMRGLGFYRPCIIKKGVILHNGVDTNLFRRGGGERRDGEFVIGCIGNFGDWKDQITLLKALKLLKSGVCGVKLRARLVGSGEFLGKCIDYVKTNGLAEMVTFEKEVEHSRLPDFYHSIDLFVLPSYFEGFGCVFTEAWACGVPFITCKGQGMDDMIAESERDIWFCRPCDAEDLAWKIHEYILKRPVQKLTGEVDIDKLVPRFLDLI